ncbi:hypothetical protein SEA_PUREGLOBE5_122 [Arthrobacter phage Pureglobe5]|nr:hypothetical protein SEA_PUREGLOBE5_122 [Arthrobacter phage Pureglobe5]
MEHLLTHPTSDTFACGADAVGRRNPRAQMDPRNTTCRRCVESEAFYLFAAHIPEVRDGH